MGVVVMSESSMRQRLCVGLRPLDGQPIENRLKGGTPDVNYIDGWMELKWLRSWPVRDGVISLPHYTNGQRLWLRRRGKRGGIAMLVLQVGKHWFFFDWEYACDFVGKTATRLDLEWNAVKQFPNGLKNKELVAWLRSL